MLMCLAVGLFVDRFGPRWLSVIGLCVGAAGLALTKFVNSESTYLVAWGITSLGFSLSLTIPVEKTVANWFIRKRGLAIGIKAAINGAVTVLVVPIVTWLVAVVGWRMTCLLWSAVILACVPLFFVFIKEKRPEYYGLLPDGARLEAGETDKDLLNQGVKYAASFEENEFTLKQATRTSSFWMVAVCFVIFGLINAGFTIHIIPLLTDLGLDATVASGLMSMMIFFTVPSQFLGGAIVDRMKKGQLKFLLAGSLFLYVVGIGTFLLAKNMFSVYTMLILYGFSTGIHTPVMSVALGRYFGRKAFGSILGIYWAFTAPMGLLAPVYSGWIYDTTGSYATSLILFALLSGAAGIVMCLISVPKLTETKAIPRQTP